MMSMWGEKGQSAKSILEKCFFLICLSFVSAQNSIHTHSKSYWFYIVQDYAATSKVDKTCLITLLFVWLLTSFSMATQTGWVLVGHCTVGELICLHIVIICKINYNWNTHCCKQCSGSGDCKGDPVFLPGPTLSMTRPRHTRRQRPQSVLWHCLL